MSVSPANRWIEQFKTNHGTHLISQGQPHQAGPFVFPEGSMSSDDKLLCPLDEKANREIANQAGVIEYLAYVVGLGRNRITEADILEIHDLTISGIYPCAGRFRDVTTKIAITDTKHQPSPPDRVKSDLRDMLEYLYGPGMENGPVHRSAFVMWKINAIHPFNGGNGRVARAAAYLVIALEVAPVFAGESMPTKLKRRKAEYVAGLKAADGGNLMPLEELVLECYLEQTRQLRQDSGIPPSNS
jgi:Fic family protein